MLRSMTAFGRAEAEADGRKITVELRSVNNRYFECSVRMPRSLGFSDDKVKSFLSAGGISRGKVDVSISVERTEPLPVKVGIDRAYAEGYIAALRELAESYDLRDDISVMRVAANRDVFTFEKADEDSEKDWAFLRNQGFLCAKSTPLPRGSFFRMRRQRCSGLR